MRLLGDVLSFAPPLCPAARISEDAFSSMLTLPSAARLPGASLDEELSHRATGWRWGVVDTYQRSTIIRRERAVTVTRMVVMVCGGAQVVVDNTIVFNDNGHM